MSDGWTPPPVITDQHSEIPHLLGMIASLIQPWFADAACQQRVKCRCGKLAVYRHGELFTCEAHWEDGSVYRKRGFTYEHLFHPTREDDINARRAKVICRSCPVIAECRAFALTLPYNYPGVWGGWTQRERQRARSASAKGSTRMVHHRTRPNVRWTSEQLRRYIGERQVRVVGRISEKDRRDLYRRDTFSDDTAERITAGLEIEPERVWADWFNPEPGRTVLGNPASSQQKRRAAYKARGYCYACASSDHSRCRSPECKCERCKPEERSA